MILTVEIDREDWETFVGICHEICILVSLTVVRKSLRHKIEAVPTQEACGAGPLSN